MTPAVVLGDIPSQGIVRNVLSDASGWAWDKVAGGIAEWVLGAVGYFVEGVVAFLTTSSSPDVASVWFSGPESPYAAVRSVAGVMLVGFALVGLIQGVVRGDVGAMVGRIAGGLPAAVLAMVATTAVVAKLVALTDALAAAVLDPAGSAGMEFLSGFGAAAVTGTGGFAVVVIGLLAVVAGLALWAELLVRSALIYLLVALSPLAFAATLWPAARGLCRRLVELLLAVVVSKFVICVAVAVGVASLGGAGSAAGPDAGVGESAAVGLATLVVGTVILCLSAFAPFVVLKLLPLAEAAVVAQGVSRSPVRAAQGAARSVYAVDSLSRIAGGRGGRASSGDSGGGPGGVPGPGLSRHSAPAGGGGAKPAAGGAGAAGGGAGAAVSVGVAADQAGARRMARSASSASGAGGEASSPSEPSRSSSPNGPDRSAGKRGVAPRPEHRGDCDGRGT